MKTYLIAIFMTICCLASADEAVDRANGLLRQKIVSECTTGNTKRVTRWCTDKVREKIDHMRPDERELRQLLVDQDLDQLCRMAHYFAALSKDDNRTMLELKDKAFIQWLIDTPGLLEQLDFSGRASRAGLTMLHHLWQTEKPSGPILNLALGTSIVADRYPAAYCLEKYRFYRDAHNQKRLYPQFDTLEPWEMAILLDGKEDIADLAWGLDYINQKKIPAEKAPDTFQKWIKYRMTNDKGVSIHRGAAFYDHKPRSLETYVEYGGVCGAVSTAACRFLKTKGVPGFTIGQPGHCAYIYKHTDNTWKIGNNIYGWQWSSGNHSPWEGPTALINTVARYRAGGHAHQSGLCSQLAKLTHNPALRSFMLQAAIKADPSNIPAWRAWLALLTAKASERDVISIVQDVKMEFHSDPFAFEYILSLLPLDWSKPYKYKLCSLLLSDNQPKASFDIYMKRFVKLASEDIPDLKKKELAYTSKNKHKWFDQWADYNKANRSSSKTRKQTLKVIELALDDTLIHEQIATRFITLYEKLLDQWNDPKLNQDAAAYVKAKLEESPSGKIGKLLIALNIKLTQAER